MNELISPHKLFSRSSVLEKQCPVPKSRGLYAWFFKEIPPHIPTDGCAIKDNLKRKTSEAYEKGIFGAPTFVSNNKIFWGQDRIEFVLKEASK